MKNLTFFILLFILMGANVFSQQCGYDNYYLFAVNVHTQNSTAKIPNLKMYLVNEQDIPLLVSVTFLEGQQWTHRSDTLFFWDNDKAKKELGTAPLMRQKFYKTDAHYVVAFYLNPDELSDPEKYPIYKLKIEAVYNEITDSYFPTQIVHLPIGKAINICENHLHHDVVSNQNVLTYDKQIFKPIEIILNQTQFEGSVVQEQKNGLQYTVRFDYQTIPIPSEESEAYILNGVKVYNTQTGKLHQEIYIPRISKSPWKDSRNVVKFIDFYNRGINEAADFSVQIESWRDLEIKGYRQKLNYYIFNTTTRQYELDTVLSNYNDVFYYEPLKTMRRYDFQATDTSRIAVTYQLENKMWVLIDKSEVLFNPFPPKIKYSSTDCISVMEKSHMLPLKAVIGNKVKLLVKDTFWLYNVCKDTLYISNVQSAAREFFSINQTLLPKQQTPLIFNGFLTNDSYDFTTHHFNCALTLTDGSVLGLGIIIPTVSNHATVYYNADSSINYAIANREKERFATAVFTYPNGNLKAKGTIQDRDTTLKVGNWLYFKNGDLSRDEVVYSKALSMSAFDDTYGNQHNQFKVKVLEKGIWKEPIIDAINNEVRLFITPKTDSIVAYTDTTSYRFALHYKNLPTYINKQFYLLKPNDRTLKLGYYEMPFEVLKDQYAIILNYSHFKSGQKTTYQLTDSLIGELQKQFPKIATVWISKNMRGISLQNMKYEEKGKVLAQLAEDSTIAFVCQLYSINHQQRLGFCDNKVIAEIDLEDPEKFRRTALKLGFSDIEIDSGNNRFWLTYPGKLIDEGFFEAFNRLTRKKLVFAAYLNSYFEPELDSKIGE